MNDQAANRLLKTLEEPPSFAHLLLLTDRREDVLATIASRCQHVRFDPLAGRDDRARADGGGGCPRRRGRGRARGWRWATRTARALLAGEEGRALRGAAEGFVRSALARRDRRARPWVDAARGRQGARA